MLNMRKKSQQDECEGEKRRRTRRRIEHRTELAMRRRRQRRLDLGLEVVDIAAVERTSVEAVATRSKSVAVPHRIVLRKEEGKRK